MTDIASPSSPRALPALTDSALLRYITFTLLYAAQGLPHGLLAIAIPAWMAEQGLGTAQIGVYLGVILLPWSLKLINGAVMDRFSFIPMGRRRPWVLSSQLGIVTSMASLMLIPDPLANYSLLTLAGFVINLFTAFQDVAVDGMAIDVLPPGQQARANGFMWGGKTLGVSGGAAASGAVLGSFGLGLTGLFTGLVLGVVMMIPLLLRERPGERLLPWSEGEPSESARIMQLTNWRSIGGGLLEAFLLPTSLQMVAITFLFAVGYGMMDTVMPVLTVQELGWDDAEYSQIVAMAGLVAGIVGMVVGGTVVQFFGRIRLIVGAIIVMIAVTMGMGLISQMCQDQSVVIGYLVVYYVLYTIVTIAFLSTAMILCRKRVSATQFALYMAILNLGNAAGAGLTGPLDSILSYEQLFFAISGFWALMLALLWMVDLSVHQERINRLDRNAPQTDRQ
ncbi:MAG: MFS transporter [Candidatus Latescibacterota bacterium]|nr:MFS transporter [Candidatus Latescibacterota bacterium]